MKGVHLITYVLFTHRALLAPNGVWLKEGDILSRKKYAQTLRDIGTSGNASYFYEGQFMEEMVKDLKKNGAILEEKDFLEYKAIKREPVESEFDGMRVLGVPPPASGGVLALILNILQGQSAFVRFNTSDNVLYMCLGYDFTPSEFGTLAYHRIVESFKFAYGQRLLLGDPAFNATVEQVCMYVMQYNIVSIL